MNIEKKIYSGWAFSENELDKRDVNMEIYKTLKGKAEVRCVKNGYGHNVYEIKNNPENLSTLELALICDDGNLCFGYRLECGKIVIHTD